ncbi:hypothetical protein ACGFZR_15485 [Streptomyces sp. NPDC048241]|uniref:hypothetical protein n=1 Tax=Streptomyces sp. NPDC048241 TaxID=3365521 RepID=UPI0037115C3E
MTRRPYTDHQQAAALLRQHPTVWQRIAEYNGSQSAYALTRAIRSGTYRISKHQPTAYQPAGAYEARRELTEQGCEVWARYIGEEDT